MLTNKVLQATSISFPPNNIYVIISLLFFHGGGSKGWYHVSLGGEKGLCSVKGKGCVIVWDEPEGGEWADIPILIGLGGEWGPSVIVCVLGIGGPIVRPIGGECEFNSPKCAPLGGEFALNPMKCPFGGDWLRDIGVGEWGLRAKEFPLEGEFPNPNKLRLGGECPPRLRELDLLGGGEWAPKLMLESDVVDGAGLEGGSFRLDDPWWLANWAASCCCCILKRKK